MYIYRKNTTSKIQACDASIIHVFKTIYEKELFMKVIDSPINVADYLKELTLHYRPCVIRVIRIESIFVLKQHSPVNRY